MVYFSLFGIHEEIPVKQTARLLPELIGLALP